MYSFLLKKALPFTLTFVFGAALAGLLGMFGSSGKKFEYAGTRAYDYGGHCRMRQHNLVALTKPLNILNVPEAAWPDTFESSARVQVTFGADGKVQNVAPVWERGSCHGTNPRKWEVVESAARQIRFEPETVDGRPVTVTREVEIRFAGN